MPSVPMPTKLTLVPLTPDRWPDLERLFGERGACGGCWCMAWRLTRSAFERGKGAGNRRAFRQLVESDTQPGVLAYECSQPVGWCSVAPRTEFGTLARSRVLQPVDDRPVWSISCLFVARSHRRRGISVRLIDAAARFARKRGARVVEGYPVEPSQAKMPDVFAWTGVAAAYQKAGFHEVARRSKTRPIFRRVFQRRERAGGNL